MNVGARTLLKPKAYRIRWSARCRPPVDAAARVRDPGPPRDRPKEVERVGLAVEPRDGSPDVDQVIEPDRPRTEPEQCLELDDRERQRQQAERDRDGQPEEAPLLGAAGQDRPEDDRDPRHPG